MVLLDEESDGEDSAVSLSDLADGEATSPPQPAAEPFEFLSSAGGGGGDAMCAANDVISGGKLLPFRAPGLLPAKTDRARIGDSLLGTGHRRSSSTDDRPKACFWDPSSGYRRLRRVADPDPVRARPKWYLMAFGSVRVPAGMEMSEIRIRQRRRNSPPPPPPTPAEDCGSWKLLRSLSCKGVEVAGVP